MNLTSSDTKRILLVEDNLINQKVAQALLKAFGLDCITACNGAEALQLLQQAHADLVLMDIQMPVMDGLQATQAIRALPGPLGNLPIVAMTASDSPEDVDICKQVGMNDFIAKPIQRARLQQVLSTWLSTEVVQPDKQMERPAGAGLDNPVINQLRAIPGLDVDKGLHVLHEDAELYLHLLTLFLHNHHDDGQAMLATLARNDGEATRQLAHGLRGAAGNLGLTRLQERATSVEAAIKLNQSADRLQTLATALNDDLAACCQEIEPLLPCSPEPAASADIDWPQVDALLDELEPLLISGDTQAHQLFAKSRALLLSALGQQAENLGHRLDDFDFDAALAIVKTSRATDRQEK